MRAVTSYPAGAFEVPADIWQRIVLFSARSDLPAMARVSKTMYEITISRLYCVLRITDQGPLFQSNLSERVTRALRRTTILDMRAPMRKDLHPLLSLPALRTVLIDLPKLELLARRPSGTIRVSSNASTVILSTYLFFETAMTPLLMPGRPPVDRITYIFPRARSLILRLSPIHLSGRCESPIMSRLDPAIRSVTLVFEPNGNARSWHTCSGEYTQQQKPYIVADTLATFVSTTFAEVTIVGLEGVHSDLRPDHLEPLARTEDVLAGFVRRMTEFAAVHPPEMKHTVAESDLGGRGPLDPAHGRSADRFRLLSMREFVEQASHPDEMEILRLDRWAR